jgi:putative aldouronate transport system substrate-binding protein
MDVPETLDEYEDMFYAFAKEDPDKNGKNDTYGLSATMVDRIYGAFGMVKGYWSLVDGKLACDDIQPGMKEALRYLNKWYNDGVLDPEFVTGENQGGYWAITHTFVNGRIGSTSMGNVYHWTPPLPGRAEGADYTESSKVGIFDDLVFADPPIGPGGLQASGSQGELMSNSFLIFGTQLADEPDKMGKLFEMSEKMFNGDKDMFLTVFMGIKDKHWEYDANGFPKFIGSTVARDAQAYGAWGSFLWFQFANESAITDGSVIKFADERNFREGIKWTMVPGFINTPARSQYQAELNKIRDETFTAIITGDQPISAFDEYVAKWKRSGGDQLTSELNAWYDTVK